MAIYLQVLLITFLFVRISSEIYPTAEQALYDENNNYQKEVLIEDDYTEDSDSITEGQKKSYILDDAHMERWQKRLRWISKWMDQMSANYARGQPRMFERYSRGRLDRMPLSYGKRSPVDEAFFLKEDNGDLLRNIRLRMPVAYRKSENYLQDYNNVLQDIIETITDQRESELNKSEDEIHNEPFVFVDDARDLQELPRHSSELNRVPLRYGKRSWQDFFSSSPYNRNSRSRLDRMPLLYGKRGDESIYVDCPKEESSRPVEISVTREKEGQFYIKCNPVKSLGNMPTKEHAEGEKDLTGDKSHKMSLYFNEISPLVRVRRSLFERAPFLNSKDIYNLFQQPINPNLDTSIEDVNPKEKAQENLDFYKRSRLDSMPLTYGKRLMNSIELYSKRSRLNRMPLTYGKRDVATPEEIQSGSKDSEKSKTVLKEIVNKEMDKPAIRGNSSIKESNHNINI